MRKFHYIRTIKDVRKDFANSMSYHIEKITCLMNVGKGVWIKYYAFTGLDDATVNITGKEQYEGTPAIMLYVTNKNQSCKVYTYDGILSLQKITEHQVRQYIIVNIDEIIIAFRKYILSNKKRV